MYFEIDNYQDLAMSTRLETADEVYAMLGLSGEVGELHGYIAKVIRDDTDIDREHIKKELGDILWFIAAIAHDQGLRLSEIADTNINKLKKRKAAGTLQGSGDNR